jgi:maltose alpha-D-glucosyltransferase / alpha-amylase
MMDNSTKPVHELFLGEHKAAIEAALADYISTKRWFGGKARTIRSVELLEAMPVEHGGLQAFIGILGVNYTEGEPQQYVLPLRIATGEEHERGTVVASVRAEGTEVKLLEATFAPSFTLGLLDGIRAGRVFAGPSGAIACWKTTAFDELQSGDDEFQPTIMGAEQSNTSVKYGDTFILKMFRRLEQGTSPDLEIGKFLGEQGFRNTPPLVGAIEYQGPSDEPYTLAILQGFVPNRGDAWSYTLESLKGYYERTSQGATRSRPELPRDRHLLEVLGAGVPSDADEIIGDYIGSASLLGRRTAEMHLALGAPTEDPAFRLEAFTMDYQEEMYHAMRDLSDQAFLLMRGHLDKLPESARDEAARLVSLQDDVAGRFDALRRHPIEAKRSRCHGDYHLGQVLYTGSDFMIIDFEGEPVRSLQERRRKHSPLKDVAGMLRSFHYAAYSGLFSHVERHRVRDAADVRDLEYWADLWHYWVSVAYLSTYLERLGKTEMLPNNESDLRIVLDAHLLEKAVYELVYELNNRPDWVQIPMKGILQLVG